jgi:hypothetical protein
MALKDKKADGTKANHSKHTKRTKQNMGNDKIPVNFFHKQFPFLLMYTYYHRYGILSTLILDVLHLNYFAERKGDFSPFHYWLNII